jgi:hypothetical protein
VEPLYGGAAPTPPLIPNCANFIDTDYISMKKEILYIIIAAITILCLPALLPSKFYKSDSKTVLITAIAFIVLTLGGLGVLTVFIIKYP